MKKIKTKSLTPEHTTPKKRIGTNVKEFYYEMYHLPQKPIPKEFFERLAKDLIHWAKTDYDALKLSKFFSELGIHMKQVDRWKEMHPNFKAAIEMAKQLIADKRFDRVTIKMDVNPAMILYTQPIYDEEAHAMMHERALLSHNKEQQPTQIIVQLPDLTKIQKAESN